MAVAPIQKLRIAAHKSVRDRLLDAIQSSGLVQIVRAGDVPAGPAGNDRAELLREFSLKLFQAEEVIKCLHDFSAKGAGGAGRGAAAVSPQEFFDAYASFDFGTVYETYRNQSLLLAEVIQKKEMLAEREKDLLPWAAVQHPLGRLAGFSRVEVVLGAIEAGQLRLLEDAAAAAGMLFAWETVRAEDDLRYIVAACLKQDGGLMRGLFDRFGFKVASPEGKGTAADELRLIEEGRSVLEGIESSIRGEFASLALYRVKLFAVRDVFANIVARLENEEKFFATRTAVVIEGWIRRKDAPRLIAELRERFSCLSVDARDPAPGEAVPVDLANRKVVTPFEFVTRIYGLPTYGRIDPTPLLAPFFFVFFGFCLTDAAYGLIVTLLCVAALFKVRSGKNLRPFLMLLALCGVSTFVLGAVMGGWFGNIVDILGERYPSAFMPVVGLKNSMVLLDPNADPITLLVIALGLGVTQVCFGYLIAFWDNVRSSRFWDGIMDQAAVLAFFAGFTGVILGILEVVGPSFMRASGLVCAAAALAIVLTAGRHFPGIGARLFNGVFFLYNVVSGYISDILSYSRLWALGLVTGVMAMTCNVIAFMVGDMVPVVGILVTAAILLFGHAFTLAINVLGALIHSGRLQFVEFFPKFFRGGGKQFQPLALEYKYTVFK